MMRVLAYYYEFQDHRAHCQGYMIRPDLRISCRTLILILAYDYLINYFVEDIILEVSLFEIYEV
jgi:hypothetical protein